MKSLVVLSHLMTEDCILSVESIARAELAINTFKTENFMHLITSGWAYHPDCNTPIADVVKNYIVDNSDISRDSIISLTDARDTVGDAFFCLNFLWRLDVQELFVITSDYHVHRTKLIFDKFFDDRLKVKVFGAKTNSITDQNVIDHEAHSIDAFNKTFSETDCSKLSSISQTLCSHHPFYNGQIHPKI